MGHWEHPIEVHLPVMLTDRPVWQAPPSIGFPIADELTIKHELFGVRLYRA